MAENSHGLIIVAIVAVVAIIGLGVMTIGSRSAVPASTAPAQNDQIGKAYGGIAARPATGISFVKLSITDSGATTVYTGDYINLRVGVAKDDGSLATPSDNVAVNIYVTNPMGETSDAKSIPFDNATNYFETGPVEITSSVTPGNWSFLVVASDGKDSINATVKFTVVQMIATPSKTGNITELSIYPYAWRYVDLANYNPDLTSFGASVGAVTDGSARITLVDSCTVMNANIKSQATVATQEISQNQMTNNAYANLDMSTDHYNDAETTYCSAIAFGNEGVKTAYSAFNEEQKSFPTLENADIVYDQNTRKYKMLLAGHNLNGRISEFGYAVLAYDPSWTTMQIVAENYTTYDSANFPESISIEQPIDLSNVSLESTIQINAYIVTRLNASDGSSQQLNTYTYRYKYWGLSGSVAGGKQTPSLTEKQGISASLYLPVSNTSIITGYPLSQVRIVADAAPAPAVASYMRVAMNETGKTAAYAKSNAALLTS